jgi:hypothetical protein
LHPLISEYPYYHHQHEKTNTGAVNLANISKRENAATHTIDFQGDINANKNDILMNCLLLV